MYFIHVNKLKRGERMFYSHTQHPTKTEDDINIFTKIFLTIRRFEYSNLLIPLVCYELAIHSRPMGSKGQVKVTCC